MMTVHNNVGREFKCSICPYQAVLKNNLNQHIRTVHDKVRNHICKICGYAASRGYNLRIHMKHMHDKIKDNICEECGYAASEKGDLKKHRDAVHNTGEKFKCGLCPYESSWKRHVAKHMRDKHQRENNIQRRFGGEVPKEEAGTDNPQPDEQDELDRLAEWYGVPKAEAHVQTDGPLPVAFMEASAQTDALPVIRYQPALPEQLLGKRL